MKIPTRTKVVTFKATPEEFRAWKRAAAKAGKRLSAFLRDAANAALVTERPQ